METKEKSFYLPLMTEEDVCALTKILRKGIPTSSSKNVQVKMKELLEIVESKKLTHDFTIVMNIEEKGSNIFSIRLDSGKDLLFLRKQLQKIFQLNAFFRDTKEKGQKDELTAHMLKFNELTHNLLVSTNEDRENIDTIISSAKNGTLKEIHIIIEGEEHIITYQDTKFDQLNLYLESLEK